MSNGDPITVQVIFRDIFGTGKSSALTSKNNEVILKLVKMHILEMEDVLFHLNSAVMMPENPQGESSTQGGGAGEEQIKVSGIKALALVFKQFEFDPEVKMVVSGHTDTSGTAEFNFKLSKERALNILYLLYKEEEEDSRKKWAEVCYNRQKVEDYQQILTYFEKKLSCGCDPQGIDDTWGDDTKKATENFLIKMGLGNVKVKAAIYEIESDQKKRWPVSIWELVYDLYSKELYEVLEITDAELESRRKTSVKFVDDDKKIVACGESFPIDAKEKSNYRSQKNRRVELLFFDKDEAPDLTCPAQIKKVHKEEDCPLWRKFYFVPLYIDPDDLKAIAFHLQFVYYDKIKKKQLPVPAGLTIKAYEDGHKEILSETVFKDGVYFVKVKFKEKIKDPARKEFYFEYETTDRWVFTKDDKTDPEIVTKTADEIKLLSFKDRQCYYDLPQKWSSKKYWTHYSGDFKKADRFEKVFFDTTFADSLKLKPFGDEITKKDKPLVFSLDDFVLTDSDFIPISQPAGTYTASILDEDFAVHDPDTANKKSYYTKDGITVANDLLFVRVPAIDKLLRGVIIKHVAAGVTFKYKLFVVFDDRVPPGHELSGHRAAVFEHKERCILVKRFQQRHQRDYHNIGKFDAYLLKDLLLNKDNEQVSYIFNYFRWFLKGKNPPVINQLWIDTAITNLTNEWNQKSDNQLVALITEKEGKKYRIFIRFHIEQVPDADKETLVNVNAAGTGRSNMGRDDGNIKIDEHQRNAVTKSFTGAHEYGHAGSLDDDYIETVDYCSYFRLGFLDFKPGGPFNLDANAMMKSNKEVRSRYFWHHAVWMHKEFIKGENLLFKVIRKNKPDFEVPDNPADTFDPRDFAKDAKHYVNHPFKLLRDTSNSKSTQTHKGKFHLYLYPIGKDEYSEGGLYGAEKFTALLVVIVNIYIESWTGNPNFMTIYNRLIKMNTDITTNFVTSNGIRIKGTAPFGKTFVQIVPRFLVNHYASNYTSQFPTVTNANFNTNRNFALGKPEGKKHLIVKIVTGNSSIDLTEDPPELNLKNTNTELDKFWKYFSQTLGLPFAATLDKNNFGVGNFVPGGVVEKI
jgi:outer membrane protein OmpA-like peptidoglycan-associated protein